MSVLAGSTRSYYNDGVGTAAEFKILRGIAISSTGVAFVTDIGDWRIRQVTTAGMYNALVPV